VLVAVFLLVRASRGDAPSDPLTTQGAPTASGTPPTAEAGLGPLDSQAPVVGEMAPDFVLRRADGATVKLSELRGKVVYVNFWASWCVPCRKELPDIQKIYDEKRDAGLEVLAINWKDDVATATGFFTTRDLTLPLLLDSNGAVYEQYKLQGLPDSFFIDREGRIASLQYGQVSEQNIRDRLRTAGLP
jgi:peroxiredoxin